MNPGESRVNYLTVSSYSFDGTEYCTSLSYKTVSIDEKVSPSPYVRMADFTYYRITIQMLTGEQGTMDTFSSSPLLRYI